MLKTLLPLFFLIVSFSSIAQNQTFIENILNGERTKIERISPKTSISTTLLPSNFAKDQVLVEVPKLKDLTVIKIYYVYTAYKQSPSFSQKSLDLKRFSELERKFGGIVSDPYIEWEIIEQTGCQDYTNGNEFFHGFVIVHRPIITEEERNRELTEMKSFLDNPKGEFKFKELDPFEDKESEDVTSLPNQKANYKDGTYALYNYLRNNIRQEKISVSRDDKWIKTEVTIDSLGKVSSVEFPNEDKKYIQDEVRSTLLEMPEWVPEIKNGQSVSSVVHMEIRVSYSKDVNGMYTRDGRQPIFDKEDLLSSQLEDSEMTDDELAKMIQLEESPLYKSLELLDSEKIALVMDVTASMNRELASLNWWIYNNMDTLRITSYNFFNDGDNMPDRKKKIGSIGGIYQAKYIRNVAEKMMDAMRAGNGGDSQENDLEAVNYAIRSDQNSEAVLLIADNYSDVRDMELLFGITKKVHVLVCANPKVVRTDYLDIAKATGGTIIVNGRRYDLSNVNLGGRITIGESTYMLSASGFKVNK